MSDSPAMVMEAAEDQRMVVIPMMLPAATFKMLNIAAVKRGKTAGALGNEASPDRNLTCAWN